MIRREAPEVITGARGPRDVREAQVADRKAKRNSGLGRQPEGKLRFQARFSNLRIQLTAPPDLRDPFTGRLTPGRPKAAQFKDGFYDVDLKETDKIGWLKDHPSYGKSFWLWSDVMEAARKQELANVKRILEDPDQRAAVLEALKESSAEDFNLPAKEENE